MKSWRNLLIAFGVFLLFWGGLNAFLSWQIKSRYNYRVNIDAGDFRKGTGVCLQQTSLDKGDIMMFGSSELGSFVDQTAVKFFPTKDVPYMINPIGRAGVLTLEDALNIQNLDFSKNKKVVILLSYSWFAQDSASPDSFYANFSKIKFYRFMTDLSVPTDEKMRMASRVSSLIRTYKNTNDFDAYAYAELCKKGCAAFPAIQVVSYPYLLLQEALLTTKDLAASYLYIKDMPPYDMKPAGDVDWDSEYNLAEEQGRANVSDSQFYFDRAYAKKIKDILPGQKNIDSGINLTTSQEFKDYDLLLKTCVRKNIKPLIIVQSVNGWYYDYRGVSSEKRDALYKELCQMAASYGFTAYDMSGVEYTPYTFYDHWHLGWKGWLYVNQKITDYFGTNS